MRSLRIPRYGLRDSRETSKRPVVTVIVAIIDNIRQFVCEEGREWIGGMIGGIGYAGIEYLSC
jgi:hypothetical protein